MDRILFVSVFVDYFFRLMIDIPRITMTGHQLANDPKSTRLRRLRSIKKAPPRARENPLMIDMNVAVGSDLSIMGEVVRLYLSRGVPLSSIKPEAYWKQMR